MSKRKRDKIKAKAQRHAKQQQGPQQVNKHAENAAFAKLPPHLKTASPEWKAFYSAAARYF